MCFRNSYDSDAFTLSHGVGWRWGRKKAKDESEREKNRSGESDVTHTHTHKPKARQELIKFCIIQDVDPKMCRLNSITGADAPNTTFFNYTV